jgi:hypothetical protein
VMVVDGLMGSSEDFVCLLRFDLQLSKTEDHIQKISLTVLLDPSLKLTTVVFWRPTDLCL